MSVLSRKDKAVILIAMLMACSPFFYQAFTQSPPGPNTIQHGEGINTPTVTTDHYYLGTTGPSEITDRLQGTWDVGISSPYVNGTEYYLDSVEVTDTLQYPELGYSYKVFSIGGTVYVKNASSGQIDFSGVNGSSVIQQAINSVDSGKMLFASLIEVDSPITGKGFVDLVGLNQNATGLTATAPMNRMLDLRSLAYRDMIRIENLFMDGNNNSDVLVDAGHETNLWIQVRINKCFLTRAKVALVNATNIDGFRIFDSILLGSDEAGSSLITQYGVYCIASYGRLLIDQSILVSFANSHIHYKGRRLSLSHTNFASSLPPADPYIFLESYTGAVTAEVDMVSVHMETPVSGTPQASLIRGDSTLPPLYLEMTVCWLGLNSSSYGLIDGKFTVLNILGGRYGQAGSYAYTISATCACFTAYTPHMNKGPNLSLISGYQYHRYQEAQAWVSNYMRRVNNQFFSGDNSTTDFAFEHGLALTPQHVEIGKKHADIRSLGYTWGGNSTHITVTFESAPPTGTNNVVFSWRAWS